MILQQIQVCSFHTSNFRFKLTVVDAKDVVPFVTASYVVRRSGTHLPLHHLKFNGQYADIFVTRNGNSSVTSTGEPSFKDTVQVGSRIECSCRPHPLRSIQIDRGNVR
jgi:hypothetical protein